MLNEKDREPDLIGNRSFLKYLYYLAGIFLVAVVFGWYASQLIISIVPEDSQQPIAFNTYPGDKWLISFTHSVEKTPVEEHFTVNGIDDLTMTHTRFESFGWGFPYSLNDGRLIKEDNKFNLIMNRQYKEVNLRIASQAMPCIIHDEKKYDLYKLFGQGTAVKIKVQRRYAYWLDRF